MILRQPCISSCVVVALAVLTWGPAATGAVRTCLEIDVDDGEEAEGFEKLVRAEVATHPSHIVVEVDCETNLKAQMFEVGGSKQITVRVDREVPVRYTIEHKNLLASKVRQAISLVLGNDPTYLTSDITKYSVLERAKHDIQILGHNTVQLELFEAAVYTGDGTDFTTGGAVLFGKGARHWQVFARASSMGHVGPRDDGKPYLKVAAGVDLGIAYELSAISSVTAYFALGASAYYMRFEGNTRGIDGVAEIGKADAFVPAVFGRAGFRLFRLNDFCFDLFLSGLLPFIKTKDESTHFFSEGNKRGQYTPLLQVGVGIGF